jgi:hypothetical protein
MKSRNWAQMEDSFSSGGSSGGSAGIPTGVSFGVSFGISFGISSSILSTVRAYRGAHTDLLCRSIPSKTFLVRSLEKTVDLHWINHWICHDKNPEIRGEITVWDETVHAFQLEQIVSESPAKRSSTASATFPFTYSR